MAAKEGCLLLRACPTTGLTESAPSLFQAALLIAARSDSVLWFVARSLSPVGCLCADVGMLGPGADPARIGREQTETPSCPAASDRIDAAVLATPGAAVRVIVNYGARIDHIDLAAARAAGIPVSNTPDVFADSTAELPVLLMLMVSRHVGEGERQLRAGKWAGWRPTHLMGQSLTGKRLGPVGFGRIGQGTARRAVHALGIRVRRFWRA